jgi:hypothetical protein
MSTAHRLTPFPARAEECGNRQTAPKPAIRIAEPYPLLDPGEYVALCTEAAYAWARHLSAWKARLTLEPQDYRGRPYTGKLCKFLGLGKNPEAPYAGPRSDFRALMVEVNGSQPTNPDVDMALFAGRLYRITVETVTKNRKGESLAPEHWYSTVRKIHPLTASKPFNLRKPRELGEPWEPSNRPTEQPRKPTPRQETAGAAARRMKRRVWVVTLDPSIATPKAGLTEFSVGPARQTNRGYRNRYTALSDGKHEPGNSRCPNDVP